jgi:flavin reductase (DIM6/NTAB) family NADH-FMN oxidoreductase RutF
MYTSHASAVTIADARPAWGDPSRSPETGVAPADFRDALRHFPSGVTIVTLRAGRIDHGFTVSAFVAVSIDPPLVAVVVDRAHLGCDLLRREGTVFAVNILGRDQEELSSRFASSRTEDRFAAGSWTRAVTGAPVLTGALAWLDCTIENRAEAGDHVVTIGRVRASHVPRPGASPLVYWNRGYRTLATEGTG